MKVQELKKYLLPIENACCTWFGELVRTGDIKITKEQDIMLCDFPIGQCPFCKKPIEIEVVKEESK